MDKHGIDNSNRELLVDFCTNNKLKQVQSFLIKHSKKQDGAYQIFMQKT